MVMTEVQSVMRSMVPMRVTGAGYPVTRLGASLRDRATLPSPLRGLGPSGGYPSRLRSLRSLRAPLAAAARCAHRRCRDDTLGARFDRIVPRTAGSSSRRRCAPRSSRCSPRSPWPAAPLRAAPRLDAAALRASPVPASPSTGSRTARCTTRRSRVSARARAPAERSRTSLRTATGTGARTSAGTSASAFGSVLRTTACGSGRTARRINRRGGSHPPRSPASIPRTLMLLDRLSRPPGRPWFSHHTHR